MALTLIKAVLDVLVHSEQLHYPPPQHLKTIHIVLNLVECALIVWLVVNWWSRLRVPQRRASESKTRVVDLEVTDTH
ncbi:hypothetical protein FRX31_026542 [Thalictrum thalictroides]|uniref:Transmembrane protein n=1 Tax=Thalictrum thalictroides TaxID=46969 RepID=A0A7J6VI53_THATH|nr:hypothetical protein FRX31_026542 [Thalictrum thalictroides]